MSRLSESARLDCLRGAAEMELVDARRAVALIA